MASSWPRCLRRHAYRKVQGKCNVIILRPRISRFLPGKVIPGSDVEQSDAEDLGGRQLLHRLAESAAGAPAGPSAEEDAVAGVLDQVDVRRAQDRWGVEDDVVVAGVP